MIFRVRNIAFCLLFATIVLANEPSNAGEPESKPKEPTVADPQPIPSNSSTSTASPVTSSTGAPTKPTTTAEPTTKPTTTAAPTTTDAPTTKPTPEPAPTTPKPDPTTPKPAPTTPKPAPTTPKPTPQDENWVVHGPNNTVCIVANMVIKISVPFKTFENKTVVANFNVEHVQNATANGTCAPDAENLVLTWDNVTATFSFNHNVSDHTYSLSSVLVEIGVNNISFPNSTMSKSNVTKVQLNYKKEVFSVPLNYSYTCAKVDPLSLTGSTVPSTNITVDAKLTVSKIHVQAFGLGNSTKYRAPMDCVSTETPDIVPIVVGVILAGLVVMVLIAYLVGRRRALNRGYLSM